MQQAGALFVEVLGKDFVRFCAWAGYSLILVAGLACFVSAMRRALNSRSDPLDVAGGVSARTHLADYFKRKRAWPSVLALGLLFCLCLLLVGIGSTADGKQATGAARFFTCLALTHWLFLFYACLFAAQWTVYFTSRDDQSMFQIRSLRSLLNQTSGQWLASDEASVEKLEKAYEKKAQSSITSMSVLVATAAVIIGVCAQIMSEPRTPAMALLPDAQQPFKDFCLWMAVATALIASLAFIISVDALETTHNWFKESTVRSALLPYFYRVTINPKYLGFVLLMVSLVFLAAWFDPVLGAIGFVSVSYSGHRYWFPTLEPEGVGAVVRGTLFVVATGLPLALLIFT